MKKIIFASVLFATQMTANAVEFGVGAKIGTLGLGAELTAVVAEKFAVRAGFQGLQASYDFVGPNDNGVNGDELNYEGDITLSALNVFADWHPMTTAFRVSFGILGNFSSIDTTASCNNALGCEFGNSVFLPAVMGDLEVETTLNPVAPYIGIGWGAAPNTTEQWHFVADFGVAYTGSPDVEIRSNGTCNSVTACQNELRQEEQEVEDALRRLRFYPVVNLGVQYRF